MNNNIKFENNIKIDGLKPGIKYHFYVSQVKYNTNTNTCSTHRVNHLQLMLHYIQTHWLFLLDIVFFAILLYLLIYKLFNKKSLLFGQHTKHLKILCNFSKITCVISSIFLLVLFFAGCANIHLALDFINANQFYYLPILIVFSFISVLVGLKSNYIKLDDNSLFNSIFLIDK